MIPYFSQKYNSFKKINGLPVGKPFDFYSLSSIASFLDKLILPILSISITLTKISSPIDTTSSTFSTRFQRQRTGKRDQRPCGQILRP